jgi:hypothetical protein
VLLLNLHTTKFCRWLGNFENGRSLRDGLESMDTEFQGFLLRRFLSHHAIEVPLTCKFVRFLAYSSRGHDTTIPLTMALDEAWLIHSLDGNPLPHAHGFPLRVVVPSRYFYKSLKWVKRIEFLEEDRLGFWERTTGYHNEADPWKEQRLDATRFSSREECEAFKQLATFDEYRHTEGDPRVIVRANFSDWNPKTRDLSRLHLKSCDFSRGNFQGVNFREANLTFGKFEGADLSRADLTGADLEGCDFSGSILDGAIFDKNFLSAAKFCKSSNNSGEIKGLKSWAGLKVTNPDGLLEDQETYLDSLGVLFKLKRRRSSLFRRFIDTFSGFLSLFSSASPGSWVDFCFGFHLWK